MEPEQQQRVPSRTYDSMPELVNSGSFWECVCKRPGMIIMRNAPRPFCLYCAGRTRSILKLIRNSEYMNRVAQFGWHSHDETSPFTYGDIPRYPPKLLIAHLFRVTYLRLRHLDHFTTFQLLDFRLSRTSFTRLAGTFSLLTEINPLQNLTQRPSQ